MAMLIAVQQKHLPHNEFAITQNIKTTHATIECTVHCSAIVPPLYVLYISLHANPGTIESCPRCYPQQDLGLRRPAPVFLALSTCLSRLIDSDRKTLHRSIVEGGRHSPPLPAIPAEVGRTAQAVLSL